MTKSKIKKIDRIGELELKYVKEVLRSGFRSAGSGMLGRLEKTFSEKIGVAYSIGHTNGTATLHSALHAAGVMPGDEVIVPPLTMTATAMAVLHADAIPVFADVDEHTFQICPESIKRLINKKTKAIITVALYGLSPEMDKIMEIAKKHSLVVIEDDAQCFLGEYKGKMVGSMGHLSSFSFQSSKQITAGEGGMVCTNDLAMAEKARKFSVLGYAAVSATKGKITKDDIQNPEYDRHVCMGYNYRMPELCAGVLMGQLEHSSELVDRRISVAKLFIDTLKGCQWLTPQYTPAYCKNVYWALAIKIDHVKVEWADFRRKFMELGGDGIYAAWKLSYLEPMFQKKNFSGKEKILKKFGFEEARKYKRGLCPSAEKIQSSILAFKTNYWDWNRAEKQAEILKKTIKFYDQK